MADLTQTQIAQPTPSRLRFKWNTIFDHLILIAGSLLMLMPLVYAFITASYDPVTIHREGLALTFGDELGSNFEKALFEKGGFTKTVDGMVMLKNSFILGIGFAVGKIIISMMAAYAIVYFRLRFATFAFWIIFTTLLLPLEVRILPSYEAIQRLGMANTYSGLIVPLIASATGTFFFRQFFRAVPEELVEAARIDGAGPVKFFIDILVPLSRTMIAAIFIIMFVFGWNQYLWPTLITTDESLFTLVRGIKQIVLTYSDAAIPEHGQALALAIVAMLPPVLIVIFFQSWFVKGLTESDK
ncbi:sn-glycerol-3-phosphate ABC transporter permease UgpE [Ruegeria sp. 2205SS24-7]|uniref:sn-glycerol-3-phosphate ABC transporter permease UgpE n=1 Tax=Ruegeria discodermiae TaxID=3064389 RepID=UPI002741B5C8|nr:sn-glycerol-3-phosphate ABC transporter permease UgpE [Ruegeria sp. 2205SS24-7]MDP5217085.1 sn-glycerol-3-phosphate ABC transporter permease UgpE [Ruegeria sp. 2205SS24-7]